YCDKGFNRADGLRVVVNGKQQLVCCEGCRIAAGEMQVNASEQNQNDESTTDRWSGYDRPVLQSEFVTTHPDGSKTAQLLLQGVRCAACSLRIEKLLTAVDGVNEISVNPVTRRGELTWQPDVIPLSALLKKISDLGYGPYPHTDDEIEQQSIAEQRGSLRRLIISGLGMMQVSSFAVALYAGAFQSMDPAIQEFLRLVSLLVATPVVFYAGAPFFKGAWHDLQRRSPGMDVPVALAIGAAYSASVWNTLFGNGEVYFDSATMFVFFLSVGRHLEMTGRHRVLSLSDAYARHLPRVATRLVNGQLQEVGIMELVPGDQVLVQPGHAFPADGVLENEDAHVDEALLTGESEAVLKRAGDTLVAGSINQRAAATMRVERVGADTALAQIKNLMTDAQKEKPPVVLLANRVASYFVTGVLFIAACVWLYWSQVAPERAFEITLAVLVVTCPCALALATPAAFTVAIGALAKRGLLLRRASVLEVFGRVTDVVFDKTGTLTDRSVVLQKVIALNTLTETQALNIAGALESHSEHPLASAFKHVQCDARVESVTAVPGEGLEGLVDGQRYRIGTQEFATALSGNAFADQSETSIRTIYLGSDAGLIAKFEIGEALREGVGSAVAALQARNIGVMIASGDRPGPIESLAEQLNIGRWQAALKPADKLELVKTMQGEGKVIAMVGDGINDSPVLAGANVSVAMGSGTSLAQHSADSVLMSEDLATLGDVFALAQRTINVVRQNIIWAIGYNLIALPLAASGMLAPWMAAIGMSLSSLLVTMNALRLGRVPAGTKTQPAAIQPAIAAESAA
ncbi:MAG: cation-translocating P-type ATPase, partial [Gammaproteobacteria bacterium]|nr:cation-translocating P-type ATPase [Gammaproteobacteria bacterium]